LDTGLQTPQAPSETTKKFASRNSWRQTVGILKAFLLEIAMQQLRMIYNLLHLDKLLSSELCFGSTQVSTSTGIKGFVARYFMENNFLSSVFTFETSNILLSQIAKRMKFRRARIVGFTFRVVPRAIKFHIQ
jgi:hypothetical protein